MIWSQTWSQTKSDQIRMFLEMLFPFSQVFFYNQQKIAHSNSRAVEQGQELYPMRNYNVARNVPACYIYTWNEKTIDLGYLDQLATRVASVLFAVINSVLSARVHTC